MTNSKKINIPFLLVVILVFGGLAAIGLKRLAIDTDVVKSLPAKEQVIIDALEILENHPIHDQVAVDIMIDRDNPDVLVDCAGMLAERMRTSGLFAETGMADIGAMIPELSQQITGHLPLLFTKEELENSVAPRLSPAAIRTRLQQVMTAMSGLEGIGQSASLAADPLGLRELVLARMIHLTPTAHATLYKGHLLSSDRRHLLLTGRPITAGSNTALARKLTNLFASAGQELADRYAEAGIRVTVTPVGAYRAALDNEDIIRHDVQLALGLTTAGLAVLMLFAFPRPLIGLLTLLPALAGTAAALFVYSLFHSSISILVLGFSGALISIMDDHSITYLIFLDRPHEINGKQAAREVQAIGGTMALLTTVGAFILLGFSGFPIFAELGQFTALGFFFTFCFIHLIFPKIFPLMPSADVRVPPLRTVAEKLFNLGKTGATAAVVLALVLLWHARPDFHISLSDMNTVSDETLAADRLFTSVWGDMGKKVYLMTTATSPEELQRQNDRLLATIERDTRQDRIETAFSPSMIFPGPQRSADNFAAWQHFWSPARISQVTNDLLRESSALGILPDAFSPFFGQLNTVSVPVAPLLPERYLALLGITAANGKMTQFITVTPGRTYDAASFHAEYGRDGQIFDAGYFSDRLGKILFSTFSSMLIIIAVMVTLLLFLQFLNWRLTLITLTPVVFAYICTLGTLNLLGRPLDIPGLMLSVVILGMGVDYTIYTVCGCQWYGSADHPSHILLRSAVLLAAASTIIGFGVLCFAKHSTLRSVGITSLCGIGYSLMGTFLLLPPLLQAYFQRRDTSRGESLDQRILSRYRLLQAYPRIFARGKLRFDPLFQDLPRLLAQQKEIRTVLDIGCGYGVPACWCLEYLPDTTVIGVDPDLERVRVASQAVMERGTILPGAAPDLPTIPTPVDVVLLLDMLHYLDDGKVISTLEQCRRLLAPGGILIARSVIRPENKPSLSWHLEDIRARFAGMPPHYRLPGQLADLATAGGFANSQSNPAKNPELYWLIARVEKSSDES
jgi:predicted exporter/SAM-dependent methyltransferase